MIFTAFLLGALLKQCRFYLFFLRTEFLFWPLTKHPVLGGFNPFEKYARQIGSFSPPKKGVKINNNWNHHLDKPFTHLPLHSPLAFHTPQTEVSNTHSTNSGTLGENHAVTFRRRPTQISPDDVILVGGICKYTVLLWIPNMLHLWNIYLHVQYPKFNPNVGIFIPYL